VKSGSGLTGAAFFFEVNMRIGKIKRVKKTSRVKGHTTGGGKKRAHNIGGNAYARGGKR
jgi:hypothetical protein